MTVLVDYIGRVKVEAFTSGGASIASGEVATSATQTQATIAIAGGTTTDRYVISLKAHDGSTPGKLFGVSVLEDVAGVATVTGAGYEFKKVDDDAAAGLQPYGGYLLQGIAGNGEAAYHARTRRAGGFWPAGARPVLACHQTVAYPLAFWPVSEGAAEITVDFRVVVSDASVFVDLAIYDVYGSGRLSTANATTEWTAAAATTKTLTLDVSEYGGGDRTQDLILVLLVRSADGADLGTVAYSGGNSAIDGNRDKVDITGHSLTLATTDRYKISIGDPSGSSPAPGLPFPAPRTVIFIDDPDLYIWPFFALEQTGSLPAWKSNASTLTITKLGRAEVQSIRIVETDVIDRADLKPALLPGAPASARNIKRLYNRQYEQFRRRTRVSSALPTYDPEHKTGSDIVSLWGAVERYDNDWADMAAFVARGYPSSLAADGSTVQYRAQIRISGAVIITAGQLSRALDLEIRASATSYSGGWSANLVISPTFTPVVVSVPFWAGNSTGDLVWGAVNGQGRSHHNLRGAIDAVELHNGVAGVFPFEVILNDTQTTADPRLIRVQLRGATTDHEGGPLVIERTSM